MKISGMGLAGRRWSLEDNRPIIEALIDGRLVTLRVPSALLDHVVE